MNKFDDKHSECCDTDMGVSEGSVLGLLLLLTFLNERPEHIEDGKTVIFADDTSVVVSARTPEELCNKIKCTVNSFNQWCSRNSSVYCILKF